MEPQHDGTGSNVPTSPSGRTTDWANRGLFSSFSTHRTESTDTPSLGFYASLWSSGRGRPTETPGTDQEAAAVPKIELFRKAVRNVQARRRIASFFGVDEATEAVESEIWKGRRARLASRRYGQLKPEFMPHSSVKLEEEEGPNEDVDDLNNAAKLKPSVAKMTLSGMSFMVAAMKKRQSTLGGHAGGPPTSTGLGEEDGASVEHHLSRTDDYPSSSSLLDDDVFVGGAPAVNLSTFNKKTSLNETPEPRRNMWAGLKARTQSTTSSIKQSRKFMKKFFRASDIRRKPLAPIEDMEDHRPFFTYWVTTVQILILLISVAWYGVGPIGFTTLEHRSGLVLTTSLSLQQVNFDEPSNFYVGPRAADLIHLGAKFAPCMRKDAKIVEEIEAGRSKERDTACCIRNDESGCVQASEEECSDMLSSWKKWTGDNDSFGRSSGPVCGLDPKFCEAPSSVGAFEWEDDITKWPICTKKSAAIPHLGAEHMTCEVIGHPCCIGIHASCSITTKEYCDFVHGHFHDEALLCSQVSCLNDVCGMVPFWNPEYPDQFYRLFTSLFLHAGFAHLVVTVGVQMFLMRDVEKFTGTFRMMVIYFGAGIGGNLASAVFLPYRADVGPAGSQFGLLACLIAEVFNMWSMLKHPYWALFKLLFITLVLLVIGILPWVDNFSHLGGLIIGFLLAYALLPFITISGEYNRSKKIKAIWICLSISALLLIVLVCLFYVVPVYDCWLCELFNCIPFTADLCANQNINFQRSKTVIHF